MWRCILVWWQVPYCNFEFRINTQSCKKVGSNEKKNKRKWQKMQFVIRITIWGFYTNNYLYEKIMWDTSSLQGDHVECNIWDLREFDIQRTMHRYILIIKQTRCTSFSSLFLEWNTTCFGQLLCPSSGVQHCKIKAIPLQAWSGPEGSRKLRFSHYMTTA